MKKFILLALLTCISTFINATGTSSNNTAPQWQALLQSGDIINSAQYANKPIILHFWATWCPYCKRLQPKLVELQKKYADQGVEIVAISFNEDDGAKPQDELEKRGFHFKTAVNGEKVAKLFAVKGTPTTFFINKNNEIVYATTSSNTRSSKFEQAIITMLKTD
jgi:thiol-disulfide isomerase/thioredoxin